MPFFFFDRPKKNKKAKPPSPANTVKSPRRAVDDPRSASARHATQPHDVPHRHLPAEPPAYLPPRQNAAPIPITRHGHEHNNNYRDQSGYQELERRPHYSQSQSHPAIPASAPANIDHVSHPPANYPHPSTNPPPYPGWGPNEYAQDQPRSYQPVIVNHHYYLSPAMPEIYQPGGGTAALTKLTGSVMNLATDPMRTLPQLYDEGMQALQTFGPNIIYQTTGGLYDQICGRFGDLMTLIEREGFVGNEALVNSTRRESERSPRSRGQKQSGVLAKKSDRRHGTQESRHTKGKVLAAPSSLLSSSYFAKVDAYANSRLSTGLYPLRLYLATWPIICLAAQYAERVYDEPQGKERDTNVSGDWRTGTKAMVIKSVPMDQMNTIVFAIRGTSSFMDWAVNLNTAPTSPTNFLDDAGNMCHSGFLSVARGIIKPVAARLRQLLEEDPSRSNYSLLITGHSAGGAVASLLYSHMLSTSPEARSELNMLTNSFRRVHCITFGAPPVSLLPLTKPDHPDLRKSLFMSFVNEGDPVVRAEKAYVKSLLELFITPSPDELRLERRKQPESRGDGSRPKGKGRLLFASKSRRPHKNSGDSSQRKRSPARPVWRVPPATLSNPGHVILLRSRESRTKRTVKKTVDQRLAEGATACTIDEQMLRGVIWGDPVCHSMRLYLGRVEQLAVEAVTAQGH